MKAYNVTFVEIVNKDRTTSRCQWYDSGSVGHSEYGAVSSKAQRDVDKETFHNLVFDVVIPKVVQLAGNKVTKTAVSLIDGYDCYYTTNDSGDVFVCFTSVETPKILPLRALTQLKSMRNDSNDMLKHNLNTIVEEFHKELLSYHDSSVHEATQEDLQTIINVMNDNIDKFLQRQERISLLVDQTSQLNQCSYNFQRKAIRIKRKMWWNNVKLWAVCVLVAIIFILILWSIIRL